jgi:hypothetical protein
MIKKYLVFYIFLLVANFSYSQLALGVWLGDSFIPFESRISDVESILLENDLEKEFLDYTIDDEYRREYTRYTKDGLSFWFYFDGLANIYDNNAILRFGTKQVRDSTPEEILLSLNQTLNIFKLSYRNNKASIYTADRRYEGLHLYFDMEEGRILEFRFADDNVMIWAEPE